MKLSEKALAAIGERITKIAGEEVKKLGVRKSEFVNGDTGPAGSIVRLISKRSAKPEITAFQKKADDVYLVASILKRDPRELGIYQELLDMGRSVEEIKKAMDTVTATAGKEWVPTGFSAELVGLVSVGYKVAALHPRIDMPYNPFKINRKNSRSTLKLRPTENAALVASSVGTDEIIFNARTGSVYVPISVELDEDSIVPMLPTIREDMAEAIQDGIEDATINGQKSGAIDSDVTVATDFRFAWDGYRKLVIAAAKIDFAGGMTADKLRAMRAAMGKYGVDPSKLAWVMGINGYQQSLSLKDSAGNILVQTVDKYGPNATVLTGELGKFDGIAIVVSEKYREDLNATGVFDGVTTTKTGLALVRRDGFAYGDRRQITVEADKFVREQTLDIVATVRQDMQARYKASTQPIVSIGINVTKV